MVAAAAQRLTDFVLEKAGDGLRTVIIVHANDYDVSYLRDDLQDTYTTEGFRQVVDAFRLENSFLDTNLGHQPVGERRALVHYHQYACIIQIPYTGTETLLVSLSREAGRDFVFFIEACRNIVEDTDGKRGETQRE